MSYGERIDRKTFLGMVGLGAAAIGGGMLLAKPAQAQDRPTSPQSQLIAYVGDFATAITVTQLDQSTGALTAIGSADGIDSPSFLVLSPGRNAVVRGERRRHRTGDSALGSRRRQLDGTRRPANQQLHQIRAQG